MVTVQTTSPRWAHMIFWKAPRIGPILFRRPLSANNADKRQGKKNFTLAYWFNQYNYLWKQNFSFMNYKINFEIKFETILDIFLYFNWFKIFFILSHYGVMLLAIQACTNILFYIAGHFIEESKHYWIVIFC